VSESCFDLFFSLSCFLGDFEGDFDFGMDVELLVVIAGGAEAKAIRPEPVLPRAVVRRLAAGAEELPGLLVFVFSESNSASVLSLRPALGVEDSPALWERRRLRRFCSVRGAGADLFGLECSSANNGSGRVYDGERLEGFSLPAEGEGLCREFW
jgi:hypothetical protein